jgi:predicted PurR-regulated permease PerM
MAAPDPKPPGPKPGVTCPAAEPPFAPLPQGYWPGEALVLRRQRIALLAGVAIALWVVLKLFASILLPFVAAAGIAYFLDPLATRLTQAGLPRPLAAFLLVLLLLVAALVFGLLLYPLILAQLGLLISRLPTYAAMLRDWAMATMADLQSRLGPDFVDARLRELVGSQAGNMISFLASAASTLLGGGFALFNALSLILVTPIVSFYLLRDWPKIIARIDSWLPRRYEATIREQAHEINRILAAWLRGQALCCLVLALYYAVVLSAVGLDLGLLVGIASGLLSFIPYVGSITGLFTALGLALAQFPTWWGVARVGAVFVLGQILEAYVIYPRFLGDRVELPAVWVIFALFAGGAAFGFLGVLLAVPVTATIGVLARFWLRRYLQSPLYRDAPP